MLLQDLACPLPQPRPRSILKRTTAILVGRVPQPVHPWMAALDSEQIPDRTYGDQTARQKAVQASWDRDLPDPMQVDPRVRYGTQRSRPFERFAPPNQVRHTDSDDEEGVQDVHPVKPALAQAIMDVHAEALARPDATAKARECLLRVFENSHGMSKKRIACILLALLSDLLVRCKSKPRRVSYRYIFQSFVRQQATITALLRAHKGFQAVITELIQ